jgi:hypothetical protein
MSNDLKLLSLPPAVAVGLPLGYHRIFVSDDILDEDATKRLTVHQSKYRHTTAFLRHARKPISKPEL